MEPLEAPQILTIEWEMMNKSRFVAFSVINTLTLRCLVYPLTVVKTRLQVQSPHRYSGTFDALKSIVRLEGFKALYRGFWINSVQVVSNIGYIITYEKVRAGLHERGITDSRVKGLVAGGASSLVGQTLIVPFDVISQHLMVLGRKGINPLHIPEEILQSKLKTLQAICTEIHKRDGLSGYYRGYFASLIAYVPGSACWWAFYPAYQEVLIHITPAVTPLLLVQCVAGPMSGLTTCVITNPADVVRTRIQVQRLNSWLKSSKLIWKAEGLGIFSIGLSARMLQSSFSSFILVLGYETLKRWSLSEEFRGRVKW